MRVLIDLSNAVGPYVSEICFAFWAAAFFFLLFNIIRYKSVDSFVVALLLTSLMAVGNMPSLWLIPFQLMLVHTLIFTVFFCVHTLFVCVKGRYGDYLLTITGLFGFVDVVFYITGAYPTIHGWILAAFFIAMCVISLYASGKSHNNNGRYVSGSENETGAKAVQP
jgi:glycerol-3-phosphate acyltransferase PlsY